MSGKITPYVRSLEGLLAAAEARAVPRGFPQRLLIAEMLQAELLYCLMESGVGTWVSLTGPSALRWARGSRRHAADLDLVVQYWDQAEYTRLRKQHRLRAAGMHVENEVQAAWGRFCRLVKERLPSSYPVKFAGGQWHRADDNAVVALAQLDWKAGESHCEPIHIRLVQPQSERRLGLPTRIADRVPFSPMPIENLMLRAEMPDALLASRVVDQALLAKPDAAATYDIAYLHSISARISLPLVHEIAASRKASVRRVNNGIERYMEQSKLNRATIEELRKAVSPSLPPRANNKASAAIQAALRTTRMIIGTLKSKI